MRDRDEGPPVKPITNDNHDGSRDQKLEHGVHKEHRDGSNVRSEHPQQEGDAEGYRENEAISILSDLTFSRRPFPVKPCRFRCFRDFCDVIACVSYCLYELVNGHDRGIIVDDRLRSYRVHALIDDAWNLFQGCLDRHNARGAHDTYDFKFCPLYVDVIAYIAYSLHELFRGNRVSIILYRSLPQCKVDGGGCNPTLTEKLSLNRQCTHRARHAKYPQGNGSLAHGLPDVFCLTGMIRSLLKVSC